MFKTFQTAANVGTPASDIILNVAGVRSFAPSLDSQIGRTIVDLVGYSQGVNGSNSGRIVAITNPPQEVASMFKPGSLFVLHAWDTRTGSEFDGRQLFVPLVQVRSVQPFDDTVLVEFFDGANVRVKRDDKAEEFLKALMHADGTR